MAKAATAEVELVDLSPEAMEVKQNLQSAGTRMLDKGRIQQIVERYRERNPHVANVLDDRGMPIPMPNIVVTDQFLEVIEEQLIPIIEDCCDDSNARIGRKAKALRGRHTDGRPGVESLDTALAPPRGKITVPPTPSR